MLKTNSRLVPMLLLLVGFFLGACNTSTPPTHSIETEDTNSKNSTLTSTVEAAEAEGGRVNQEHTTSIHTTSPTTSAISALYALAVAPPIKGVDVPYQQYRLQANEGQEIITSTGSKITIPANAFVDKNGNQIVGEVTIQYREFHTAEDIIASGIPMHNPETGAYMQTAGMFEIKGNHKGEEIFMTATKPVKVDMLSQVAGDNYNFYQLGAKDCRWKDKGTRPAQPNTQKLAMLKKLDIELEQQKANKPSFVKSTQTDNFVFDLQIDYSRQPELKVFKNVIWEYTGTGADPEKNEWVFYSEWDGVALNPLDNGHYEMVFTNAERNFRTNVRPVLSDEDYDKALEAFNQKTRKAYAMAKEKQETIRKGLEAQADLVRSFEVENFGIYNWDIWKDDNRRRCRVAPTFDLLAQKAFEQTGSKEVQYFLVSNNNRSVVRYDNATLERFSYNPHEKNVLLAILPNGQAALAKKNVFENFEQQKNKKSWTLDLVTQENVISSIDDIKHLVSLASS